MNSQQFCIGAEQDAAAKRKTETATETETELQSESCQKLKKNQLLKYRYTHTHAHTHVQSYSYSCSYKRHLVISSNFVVFICLRCAFSLSSKRRQMKPAGDEAFGIRHSVFGIPYLVFGISGIQYTTFGSVWFHFYRVLGHQPLLLYAPLFKRGNH